MSSGHSSGSGPAHHGSSSSNNPDWKEWECPSQKDYSNLSSRDAHGCTIPYTRESKRFIIKWGHQGKFTAEDADVLLGLIESMWDVMTGPLGFDQSRGIAREKRHTHKMNIYITGTGLAKPGPGCYLGCDPEGVHFCSTSPDAPTVAHELGHLAEMGTYGFVNHPEVGWTWEACSNWFKWYFYPDKLDDIRFYMDRHREPLDNFETRYQTWFFFKYLHERFGPGFVGRLWSMAKQNERPFEVIQRALPHLHFSDIFADFASRVVLWDFVTKGRELRKFSGDERGWHRFTPVKHLAEGGEIWGEYKPAKDGLHWYAFDVVDLKKLVCHEVNKKGSCTFTLDFKPKNHSQDWRIMVAISHANGANYRGPGDWRGGPRVFTLDKRDKEAMLVVCPTGRHSFKDDPPAYSFSLNPSAS